MNAHLIFFDSNCPLCQRAIRKIQKIDTVNQFEYLPLNSEKAWEKLPKELLKGDTLVLLENGEKIWIRAKAIFRICALLGGKYGWLGALVYLPGLDFFYNLIARHRHFFDS